MMTRKSLLIIFVGLFVAAGIAWVAQPAYAGGPPPTDHLKCYKIFGEDTLPNRLQEKVILEGFQFPPEDCRIIGRAKFFCVPVSKQLAEPDSPEPGQALSSDYLCYKIRCKRPFPVDQLVSDQFGDREITKLKPFMLCGPAQKVLPK